MIDQSSSAPSGLRPNRLSFLLVFLSLSGILLISGCAGLGVRPWERDLLAENEMAVDPDPVGSGFDDHIYFSKEASSGGRTFGGGGCGCN